MKQKVTLPDVLEYKRQGQKIPVLTAYDYPSARLLDSAGVPVILVGDTLGMVVLGHKSTVPVTLEDMIHHCRAVARGAERAFLIGDLPFLTYQTSIEDAIRSAGRLIKEGYVEAVKLEGGREMAATIRAIVDAGIAVCAHIGLTPQSVSKLGGYKLQGREAEQAAQLIEDARILEAAGASMIVLEMVPAPVAQRITQALAIPTIGIGAGPDCDGQVLVFHDFLGLNEGFQPRFLKRYRNLGQEIIDAAREYCADVQSGAFPTDEHSFSMRSGELAKLDELLDSGDVHDHGRSSGAPVRGQAGQHHH